MFNAIKIIIKSTFPQNNSKLLSSKNLYSNNPSNVFVWGNKGGWDNLISGIQSFTNIGVCEQLFQINNSYNKFITCNSSIFCHQIFHIKNISLYCESS